MEFSPKNDGPIVLSQVEIDAKFKDLDMLAFLNDTTLFRRVKITKGISEPYSMRRKKAKYDWKWERYERISDGCGMAIVKWRRTLDGNDELHVIIFRDIHGNFYYNSDSEQASQGL